MEEKQFKYSPEDLVARELEREIDIKNNSGLFSKYDFPSIMKKIKMLGDPHKRAMFYTKLNRYPEIKGDSRRIDCLSILAEKAIKDEKVCSTRDPLTGLPNRAHINEVLKRQYGLIKRKLDYSFSVAMMDIDNFKRVNDAYGHSAGDDVLKRMSRFLSEVVRSTDVVGRYGGEEFLAIFPDTGLEGALIAADKIRRGVESMKIETKDNRGERMPLSITNSIGVATNNSLSIYEEDIIRKADSALYHAKNSGKNRVAFFEQRRLENYLV